MIGSMLMMLTTVVLIIIYFPKLIKNKEYKELTVSSIALLIATVTCVLYCLEILVFDPSKWISVLFNPVSDMIINLFQT